MNKRQLIEAVADETGISHEDVAAILQGTFDVIARELVRGRNVAVTNFGTWRSVKVRRRWARNPQTGERVQVRAHQGVRFRVSPRLAELVSAKRVREGGRPITTAKRPKGSLKSVA